jgi:hypothetical protein
MPYLRTGRLLTLDAVVDFLPMNSDVLRGVHANTHLAAVNAQDCNGDIVTNRHSLIHLSRENQHSGSFRIVDRLSRPSWSRIHVSLRPPRAVAMDIATAHEEAGLTQRELAS